MKSRQSETSTVEKAVLYKLYKQNNQTGAVTMLLRSFFAQFIQSRPEKCLFCGFSAPQKRQYCHFMISSGI